MIDKKQCKQCLEIKSLDDFTRQKTGKHQRTSRCKKCLNFNHADAYRKTPEVNEKQCNQCLDVKILNDFRRQPTGKYQRTAKCRECENFNHREIYSKTPRAIENKRKSYLKNKGKDKQADSAKSMRYYRKNKEKVLNYRREYQKAKRLRDPMFALKQNRRSRRRHVLKNINKNHTLQDLGCTTAEWKAYLEARFTSGMNWDNYGSYWHLDEAVPCSAWNLSNPDEQKACFHYLNSQPLECAINLRKGGTNRKDYAQEKQEFLAVLRGLGIINNV